MAKKRETGNVYEIVRGEGTQGPSGAGELLRDKAYQLIKADIIQCHLQPGEEVSEGSLVKRYEKHALGKASIRSALSRLAQDGLVFPRSRRGYLVVPITTRYVQEMYELRAILEVAAARAAVGRVDIPELKKICSRIEYPKNPDDNLKFLETHHYFHVTIAKASGNDRLTRIISNLLTDMDRLIHFSEFNPDRDVRSLNVDREVQQEQHMAIVDALAAGDPALAGEKMREHIEHSAKMTKEAIFASRLPIDL